MVCSLKISSIFTRLIATIIVMIAMKAYSPTLKSNVNSTVTLVKRTKNGFKTKIAMMMTVEIIK
jgi:hypothetical protein